MSNPNGRPKGITEEKPRRLKTARTARYAARLAADPEGVGMVAIHNLPNALLAKIEAAATARGITVSALLREDVTRLYG